MLIDIMFAMFDEFLFFFSERGDREVGFLFHSSEHDSLLGCGNASNDSRFCYSCHRLDWSCLCANSSWSLSSRCLYGSLQNHYCFLFHLCRGNYIIFSQLLFDCSWSMSMTWINYNQTMTRDSNEHKFKNTKI